MKSKRIELTDKHPNDIAETIQSLNTEEQPLTFLLLPGQMKGEVFAYLDKPTQEIVLKTLGSSEIAEVLQTMTPDDRTQVFTNFPDALIKEAVNQLSEKERKIALSLIGYEENSVGRMMIRPGSFACDY
jgi:magnesium transporter